MSRGKEIPVCLRGEQVCLGFQPLQLVGKGEQTVVEIQQSRNQLGIIFRGSQTVAEIREGIAPQKGEGGIVPLPIGVFDVKLVDDLPHDPLAEGDQLGVVGDAGGGGEPKLGEMSLHGLTAE